MNENNTTTPLKEWPGAFGIYKTSRDAVRKNIETILMIWVILFAVSVLLDLVLKLFLNKYAALFLNNILGSLISVYFSTALVYVYIASARQKRVAVNEALAAARPLYWRMILLGLLTFVSVLGGLILLIVPGIIIGMRLSLASYYLIDKNLSVMEAYKASWNDTKGNLGKMWGIIGVGILMMLPVFTIIGIIATIYLLLMYSAATALLYLYVSRKPTAS
jgi:uncharacterized membrane protein